MRLLDANLLIYAFDASSEMHREAKSWLEGIYLADDVVGIPRIVVLAFVRITTNPRIMKVPATPQIALSRMATLLTHPKTAVIEAGSDHWRIFSKIVNEGGIYGPSMTDAHLAALAIEHGAILCSHDRGFRRFTNLKFENPLSPNT